MAHIPDSLQRILQNIFAALKSANAQILPKIRSLHGSLIFTKCLKGELSSTKCRQEFRDQFNFISLFMVHSLLDFIDKTYKVFLKSTPLNWQETSVSILAAFDVLDKISTLSVSTFSSKNFDDAKRIVLLVSKTLVPMVWPPTILNFLTGAKSFCQFAIL